MKPRNPKDKTPVELLAEGLVYACLTVSFLVVFMYGVVTYFWD
jgi:hypothetical protein